MLFTLIIVMMRLRHKAAEHFLLDRFYRSLLFQLLSVHTTVTELMETLNMLGKNGISSPFKNIYLSLSSVAVLYVLC